MASIWQRELAGSELSGIFGRGHKTIASRIPAHRPTPMMNRIPFARVPEVLALTVGLAGAPTWAETSGGLIPASEIALREIASGFSSLVAISHADDERLFLVEKDLGILVLSEGEVLPDPFLDIGSLLGDGAFGNGGILSSAFHPQYPANGFFFVFYSNLINESVIARYEVSQNDRNVADPGSGEHPDYEYQTGPGW